MHASCLVWSNLAVLLTERNDLHSSPHASPYDASSTPPRCGGGQGDICILILVLSLALPHLTSLDLTSLDLTSLDLTSNA